MSNLGRGDTTDEEILVAIKDHFSPAIGTTDLADELDMSRQAAYQRLEKLVEDGLVEKYKVSRDTVYYLSPAGIRYLEKD